MSFIRRHHLLLLFLYAVTLVLGLVVARPFYNTLIESANGSIELERLLPAFDFMTFSDFVRVHGAALRPFVGFGLSIGLLYVFISSFFIGGIYAELNTSHKPFRLGEFLKNCTPFATRYWLLLVFEILTLICLLFAGGIFYFVFSLLAEGGSEREFILWLSVPTVLVLSILSVGVVITDYARAAIFHNPEKSAWQGFGEGSRLVLGKLRTVPYFWAFIALNALFTLCYVLLANKVGMTSGGKIYGVFVLQQVLVWFRTVFRVGYLSVVNRLYLRFRKPR